MIMRKATVSLVVFVLLLGGLYAQSWTYDVEVYSGDRTSSLTLTLGADPRASDCFDAGFDVPAMPPIPGGVRFFFVAPCTTGFPAGFDPYLTTDIRNSTVGEHYYIIRVEYDYTSSPRMVVWDHTAIPADVEMAQIGARNVGSFDIPTWTDMSTVDTFYFMPHQEVVIRIRQHGAVDHFPPSVISMYPADGADDIEWNEVVSFNIVDDVTGVDETSISVLLYFDIDTDGVVDSVANITSLGRTIPIIGGYRFIYEHPADMFPGSANICVAVVAADLDTETGPHVMDTTTWCFMTTATPPGDIDPPVYMNWSIDPMIIDTIEADDHIRFQIRDYGVGVDISSVIIKVDGTTLASGAWSYTRLGVSYDYDIDIPPQPASGWPRMTNHTLWVYACDYSGNCDSVEAVFFVSPEAFTGWRMSINLSSGTSVPTVLTFGMDPAATDGFDPGIDIPMTAFPGFYAYFPLADPTHPEVTMLGTNIHHLDIGMDVFEVRTSGATGNIDITWDRSTIPVLGAPLMLQLFVGHGPDPSSITWFNMTGYSSLTVPASDLIFVKAIIRDTTRPVINPQITIIRPLSGATGVGPDTDIKFRLYDDNDIDSASVVVQFNGRDVTDSLHWERLVSGNGYELTYDPPGLLSPMTTYTVFVHCTDVDVPTRHPLDVSWSFTTGMICGPEFEFTVTAVDSGAMVNIYNLVIGASESTTVAYDAGVDIPLIVTPSGFYGFIDNPLATPFPQLMKDIRDNCVQNEWIIKISGASGTHQWLTWNSSLVPVSGDWVMQIAVSPIGIPPDSTDYINMSDTNRIAITSTQEAHIRFGLYAAARTYSIYGIVYDGLTGTPIDGATVTAGGVTDISGSGGTHGAYEITGLAPGSYTVSFSATGYVDWDTTVTIVDSNINVDAYLYPPTYTISGTTFVDGVPTANVRVTIGSTDVFSNSSGYYEFTGLLAGSYIIRAENTIPGYSTFIDTVTIVDHDIVVNINLHHIEYTVSGVASLDGTPAGGITISLAGTTVATTASDGSYSISLPVGFYTLEASYTGYYSSSASFYLDHDTTINFNLLPQPVRVCVNVDLEEDTSEAGAVVSMPPMPSLVTPDDGSVCWPSVDWGTYTITVSKDYHHTVDTTINVNAPTTIDIILPYYWPVSTITGSYGPTQRPLPAPETLVVVWNKPYSAYLTIDHYALYDGSGTLITDALGPNDTTYVVHDVRDGETYSFYVVVHYTDGGYSLPSPTYSVTIHINPDPNKILVIDFDNGAGFTEDFTDVLDAIHIPSYTVTDQDEDITQYNKYDLNDYIGGSDAGVFIVLGIRGDGSDEVMPAAMVNALADYVRAGGFIFVQGPDFAQDYVGTPFLDLFNFSAIDGNPSTTGNVHRVFGDSVFFQNRGYIRGSYPFGSAADNYIDRLTPNAGAKAILYANDDSMVVGVAYTDRRIYTSIYPASVTSTWDIAKSIIGGILLHAPITNDAVLESASLKPDVFTLTAAPNPFNSVCDITFEIPKQDNVTVYVKDINGRVVSKLFDGTLKAGMHTLHWDATGRSSGIYIVELKYGDLTATTKVLFVK